MFRTLGLDKAVTACQPRCRFTAYCWTMMHAITNPLTATTKQRAIRMKLHKTSRCEKRYSYHYREDETCTLYHCQNNVGSSGDAIENTINEDASVRSEVSVRSSQSTGQRVSWSGANICTGNESQDAK